MWKRKKLEEGGGLPSNTYAPATNVSVFIVHLIFGIPISLGYLPTNILFDKNCYYDSFGLLLPQQHIVMKIVILEELVHAV